MNLQTPPAHPPDQLLPPDLAQRSFWRQIFPELVLIWAGSLLIGIRIAASLAGPEALAAISLAAFVALSTSWAKGQLALRLRSGQLYLPAWQEFTANLLLGLAKLTTAAALLLELARYSLQQFPQADSGWLLPVALLALLGLAMVTGLAGQTQPRSRSWVWLVPVGWLLLGLGWLELIRLGGTSSVALVGLNQTTPFNWSDLLQATALLSVAYASYDPLSLPVRTTSAPTVRLTLKTLTIALGLGWLLLGGVAMLANSSVAPALVTAVASRPAGFVKWLTLGAIATLTGALLTLLPQLTQQLSHLSREVRPQAYRQAYCQEPDRRSVWALVGPGLILAAMLLVGDLQVFWSYSAFAGLAHAGLVQWALLTSAQQTTERRRLPRQRAGSLRSRLSLRWPSLREYVQAPRLAVCLLAFWVDWQVWLVGLSLVALGLIWRGMVQWSDQPGNN
jgi:basic amino acid/polyamine antiporter, APA family